ncbi:MAG: ectoine hydroxylase-related dioxygenase (phytanoyl-CoA dioxygenase family) [Crocinitomicaceae bacterium]|jgi:ectoine hydroxylase-related dioxygenase (phytanoyl-CoA dioxygenase family)
MNRVKFHEVEFSQRLEDDGFATFDLLRDFDIEALTTIFNDHHSSNPEGFYATTHLDDKEKRKSLSDQAMSILSCRIESHFENIELLGGAFISKAPGQKGVLPLHQDWNLLDEKHARSYNLWIPLVDVNEENGAMRMLVGSHAKQETFRGPNFPPVLYPISKEVDQYMVSLNMKRGEAVLYDHALWHSSPKNQTDELRLAFVLGVIPKGADLKYYQQNEDTVEEYASHPNFFFENDRDSGPKGLTLLRSFNHPNSFLSKEEFEEVYLGQKKVKQESKKGFFQKLFGTK